MCYSGIFLRRIKTVMKKLFSTFALTLIGTCAAWAGSICPVGNGGSTGFAHNPDSGATGCNVVITINADRTTSVVVKDAAPYDLVSGGDDMLIGVVNNSSATVPSLTLTGSSIFGLENDGICNYSFVGNTYCLTNATGGTSSTGTLGSGNNGVDPFDYYGPTSTFTITNSNTGTVNFSPTIQPGGTTFFSLEGSPSTSLAITVAPGVGGGPVGAPSLTVWAGILLGTLLMGYSLRVIRKNQRQS